MKIKSNLLLIILLFAFSSCQKGIKDRIYDKIQKDYPNKDTCTININTLTSFDWDTLYIFNTNADLAEINKVLGFSYKYWEDIADRIIFTKSKEVVYHYDEFPNPDKKPETDIVFNFERTKENYMVFSKNNAVFKVQRKTFSNIVYYELTPYRTPLQPVENTSSPYKTNMDSSLLAKPFDLNILKTLNPAWLDYYRINISKFKLDTSYFVENQLMDGVIQGDFDTKFNKNHIPFLINSPDSNLYIDLDYYVHQIEPNSKNQLVLTGGEIDQEIDLVNRNTKQIKRLEFCGACNGIEDAKWINNQEVILFGTNNCEDTNKLYIEIINIKMLLYRIYTYPYSNWHGKKSYNYDIRLKKMKFENIE